MAAAGGFRLPARYRRHAIAKMATEESVNLITSPVAVNTSLLLLMAMVAVALQFRVRYLRSDGAFPDQVVEFLSCDLPSMV